MSHAIMRIQKIKTMQALSERERHNTRQKTVLNADGSNSITVEGITGLVKYVTALEKEIDSINPRKTRKDAIRTIEVLFTSDKAFFKKVDYNQYFEECKKWLADTFGDSNILQICCHTDEETPHLHCILTTVKDNKFNYSGYIGGRQDLRNLQDSFYEKVAYLGLERGQKVEVTKATYQTTKEWHRNAYKARSYAEALSESQRLEYAIKGVMFTQENEILNTENMKLRAELKEIKSSYNGLKQGVYNALNGDSKSKIIGVQKLEQQGKLLLERKAQELSKSQSEEAEL